MKPRKQNFGEWLNDPDTPLKIELAQLVEYYSNTYGEESLRTLRAIINGKLSKRVITPEQQAKMQAARQKVI